MTTARPLWRVKLPSKSASRTTLGCGGGTLATIIPLDAQAPR
jgi:hypothetical protein